MSRIKPPRFKHEKGFPMPHQNSEHVRNHPPATPAPKVSQPTITGLPVEPDPVSREALIARCRTRIQHLRFQLDQAETNALDSQQARLLREDIGRLLPWLLELADVCIDMHEDDQESFTDLLTRMPRH